MSDLTAEACEQKYQERQDRWDLGCPAPAFSLKNNYWSNSCLFRTLCGIEIS